jgi:hypothetical protein
VSDDEQYIALDGWVWTPFGVTATFSLPRWLAHLWESDDGPSRRVLASGSRRWGFDMCFVGHRLCVGAPGAGRSAKHSAPGVTVFDLDADGPPRIVLGPRPPMFALRGLLASAGGGRLELWDLDDGARVGVVNDVAPVAIHPDTGELIAWSEQGTFTRVSIEVGNP